MFYYCRNYRQNTQQMPGAAFFNHGQVLADLYTSAGVFVRSAVVADVSAGCRSARDCFAAVRRYCDKMNQHGPPRPQNQEAIDDSFTS